MPRKPRPKVFTAAVPFSVGAQRFAAGDRVEGLALRVALRFGARFVTAPAAKKSTPEPTPESTTTPDEVGTPTEEQAS